MAASAAGIVLLRRTESLEDMLALRGVRRERRPAGSLRQHETHLQVNQYTQFGRRSRALFREIMLAVCEGLVGEKEKHCPKCRHEVSFWQLSLGTLADAYTLWLLSPIQWHDEGARSLGVRSLVPFAMQSPTARAAEERFPWVPAIEEWRSGGRWYFKVKLDNSFPRMRQAQER